MLITERELRIIELLKQYCPDWGVSADDEGFVCIKSFAEGPMKVRLLETRRDRNSNFWTRVIAYVSEMGEEPIFRMRLNVSSDDDIANRIGNWHRQVDNDEIQELWRVRGTSGLAPKDKILKYAIPLVKHFDHALHRQAFEGARIKMVDIVEFVSKLPEEKPPLIEGLINQGEVGMIYGPSGVGVTTVMLNIAAHAIVGRPFLGYTLKWPLKVGYWHFEGNPWEMKRKVEKLSQTFLGFASNLLYRREYGFKISAVDGESTLRNIIQDHQLELLIMDNLPSFKGPVDENDATEMTDDVMDKLCNVAGSTGCAIVFAHHTKRATEEKRTGKRIYPLDPRGSTEIEGKCDFTLRYVPFSASAPDWRVLESHKRRASGSRTAVSS